MSESLAQQAEAFATRLEEARAACGNLDFSWYPHDSLSVFSILEDAKTMSGRPLVASIFEALWNGLAADIGCGDGGMAFFLESLGFRVHALDNPSTNLNQMRGVNALKAPLDSKVETFPIDLDRAEALPTKFYDFVFLLGVLYHLKNPVHVLETLALHTRYAVVSTRIVRRTPDGTMLEHLPAAYLVGLNEINRDVTNYWLFSEQGLERLFERTGWKVLHLTLVDATEPRRRGEPWGEDLRAYCLVESLTALQSTTKLDFGFFVPEPGQPWRWTEPRFRVRFTEVPARAHVLRMGLYVPQQQIDRLGPVTLSIKVNGNRMPPLVLETEGDLRWEDFIPAAFVANGEVIVDGEVDKSLPPLGRDRRELGVIIFEIRLD